MRLLQLLRRVLPWALVGVALLLLLAPIDPALVERWYSGRVYPRLQSVVTPFSNRLPFAAFDVILAVTIVAGAWILGALVRGLRQGQRWRALGTAATRLLAVGAVLYIWFFGVWGLNYRRVPLANRLELAREPPTPALVLTLGQQAVAHVNELYAAAHATVWIDPWTDTALQQAFGSTQRLLGDRRRTVPGRLKGSIVGPYFRWASVDGMIDPFALEVLANPDLLPFEKPFVAAHEWAHLAGYADESEASFVGFLSCVRGNAAAQYSGWLFLYWEVSSVVSPSDRTALASALAAGPRADVAAVTERVRRGQLPQLRRVSWAAYDQYLKANRVEEGVRNYDLVITLLARARFKEGWVPVRLRTPHDATRGGAP
jgi:hypothetical protein